MHTPDQASELWCPMARIARHEVINQGSERATEHIVGGCNTDALGRTRVPASCRCIADRCAMWRWGESACDTGGRPRAHTRIGYCGLAGRPEVQ